ncbi:MAG: beta-N-acetylhexosaminidase [Alphaproteobacteria bacterium]|nr:beta-N-acetylhexosaminidase [Alphaproteobacteria bacterium]
MQNLFSPVVFGCKGLELDAEEKAIFKEANPFGIILFKRNCESKEQVKKLIEDIKCTVRDDVQILVDEEGGRVTRLQVPVWQKKPSAREIGAIAEKDMALAKELLISKTKVIAEELLELGITINCSPVLDVYNGRDDGAIGDRAYSNNIEVISELGKTETDAFLQSGIFPVIKHLPGHGRLEKDPHYTLPIITASREELENRDFVPFKNLKDAPMAMNSHAIFTSYDKECPASLSSIIYEQVIRGIIGFKGLLFSDDITMKALGGSAGERFSRALKCCDIVLHCDADKSEMKEILRIM